MYTHIRNNKKSNREKRERRNVDHMISVIGMAVQPTLGIEHVYMVLTSVHNLITNKKFDHIKFGHNIIFLSKLSIFCGPWDLTQVIPESVAKNHKSLGMIPKEMQRSSISIRAPQSNWLMMHVSMMIISYATLILGFALAITYLSANFA